MYTVQEYNIIENALDLAEASARRLSVKEGNPPAVREAYRASIAEIQAVSNKVAGEKAKVVKEVAAKEVKK